MEEVCDQENRRLVALALAKKLHLAKVNFRAYLL